VASDIVLVLGTEHRELAALIDQCGRPSRGFQDPQEDLRRRLAAHVAAATAAVHPAIGTWRPPELELALADAEDALAAPTRSGLSRAASAVVEAETSIVLPRLADLPINERRRIGKVFRIKRDGALRGAASTTRRQRSQTELYELARRAGVEQRSRMTLAQLEAAVSAWERDQAARRAH
jgi:hypothetical protein